MLPIGHRKFVPPPKLLGDSLLNSLVSYYTLDEAAGAARADSVGGNNLADVNTVGSVVGKNNNAASFVRASGSYLIHDTTALKFVNDYSISAWINATQVGFAAGEGHFLHNSWGADGPGMYMLALSAVDSRPILYDWNIVGDDPTGYMKGNAVLSWGTWYHFVVKKISGIREMWINGVKQTLSVSATGVWGSNNNFLIGARSKTTVTGSWNGLIDEVSLYSRGITDGEIGRLYNGGAGKFYPY